MDRTERFYKIDQLLKGGGAVPFSKLEEALSVSRATLKRDLQYMRDRLHAPIEYDRAKNTYRLVEAQKGPRYELPGLWFDANEVQALLTTLKLLGELQPGLLGERVAPLIYRLREIAGRGDHSWAEIEQRVRLFQPERRGASPAHFGLVAAATLSRRRIWVRHYNRGEDTVTERELSPQRLVLYRDNWYLDAYCHLREGIRSFSIDALRAVELRDSAAEEVAATELDAHVSGGYGIFAGPRLSWATLKFSPKSARWVGSQTWHPQQKTRTEGDGTYVLEVPYADNRELVMEILKYGADVEVLGPPSLRAKIAEGLRAAAAHYP